MKLIKPPRLMPGQTIGLVAPSSAFDDPEEIRAAQETIESLGFRVKLGQHVFRRHGYLAGTDEERAADLNAMFADPAIDGIFALRGGYGSSRLLPYLAYPQIQQAPKVLLGYSDITALLLAIHVKTGLVTFHGPMVAKDFADPNGVNLDSWARALNGSSEWALELDSDVKPLVEGAAEGILYGGCLSILVSSLGTPYEIQTAGTVLFIEDIAAKPYQIDRMLMQLKLAGKLADVEGIVFGEMIDCTQNKDQSYSLQDVILRVVGELGVPVAFGLRSGHVSLGNITLPFGVRAALKVTTNAVNLEIKEAATVLAASSRSAG